jgi:cytochrome c-type biogenesis protein CcmH/NrfG
MAERPEPGDDVDKEKWAAVEEATELLYEERFHEALANLRDVIKADASNPYAFFFLGQALYEVGEVEPSRDAYRACLKLAPTHRGARVALSHALRKLGDAREAVKEGMIALEQSPADEDALYAVGLAYMSRGDSKAARRYLTAMLQGKPEFETRLEVEAILGQLPPED